MLSVHKRRNVDLTGVNVTYVWTFAVCDFVSGTIAVHQRGVRQKICSPHRRFAWKIQNIIFDLSFSFLP